MYRNAAPICSFLVESLLNILLLLFWPISGSKVTQLVVCFWMIEVSIFCSYNQNKHFNKLKLKKIRFHNISLSTKNHAASCCKFQTWKFKKKTCSAVHRGWLYASIVKYKKKKILCCEKFSVFCVNVRYEKKTCK